MHFISSDYNTIYVIWQFQQKFVKCEPYIYFFQFNNNLITQCKTNLITTVCIRANYTYGKKKN